MEDCCEWLNFCEFSVKIREVGEIVGVVRVFDKVSGDWKQKHY